MMLARLETTYAVAGTNSTAKCRYLRIPSTLVHTHRVSREQRASRATFYRERPLVIRGKRRDDAAGGILRACVPREFFATKIRQLSEMLRVPGVTTVCMFGEVGRRSREKSRVFRHSVAMLPLTFKGNIKPRVYLSCRINQDKARD